MKFKKIYFLLFTALFSYSAQAVNPSPSLDTAMSETSEKTTVFSDQTSSQFSEKKLIVTRFDLANKELKTKTSNDLDLILNQIEELRLSEKELSHYAKIGAACLGTYGYCVASTLAHELGHALTAKALTGLPAHISFGSYNPASDKSIITINGINPFIGITSFWLANDSTKEIKDIIISANGPLVGILFNIAFLKLINIIDKYKNNKSIASAIKKGLTKPLFSKKHPLINLLCFNLTWYDLSNLLPFEGSDGSRIARHIPGGSIILNLIFLLGSTYLIQKYRNTPLPDTPLPSKLLPNKGLRQLL